MALTPDKIFVLAVALITWGGVFIYLLRLDRLAKALEAEVRARELDDSRDDSRGDSRGDLQIETLAPSESQSAPDRVKIQ